MYKIKKKLYSFLDNLSLNQNFFKYQAYGIIGLAALKIILVLLFIFNIMFASKEAARLMLFGFGKWGMLIGSILDSLMIIILPALVFLGFIFFIEINAGLIAIKKVDGEVENEKMLRWAKYYLILVLSLSYFLFGSLNLFTFLIIILNTFSGILYYYFTDKYGEFRDILEREGK